MKIYHIRHQAAGVVHDVPFAAVPSSEQIGAVMARCARAHGDRHPKTGLPYWAKVIEIDTDKDVDDPSRTRTVCGLNGCDAAEADKSAAGPCPIRDGEHVPEPAADGGAGVGILRSMNATGIGHVRNP